MKSYQGLCANDVPQHPIFVIKSVELIPTPVSASAVPPAGSTPVVVITPAGAVTPAPTSPVEAGQTTTTTVPLAGSPASTLAPPSGPSTTIPLSATVTVPCSAANQIADGQIQQQASCSTTSLLSTQLVVSQMHFATSGTSVGLAAGTPSAVEAGATTATPTVTPVPGAAGVAGVAGASGSAAPGSPPATTSPLTFTAGAAKTSHSAVFLSVLLAAVGFVVYA